VNLFSRRILLLFRRPAGRYRAHRASIQDPADHHRPATGRAGPRMRWPPPH